MSDEPKSAIYRVLSAIPSGKVATYGQVAELAGLARGARQVGRVLRQLPEESTLPWHRVINSQGRLSIPPGSEGNIEQKQRLQNENIEVRNGKVSLAAYQWRP